MDQVKRLKTLNLLAQARREPVSESIDRICVPVGRKHGHFFLVTVNGQHPILSALDVSALSKVHTPRYRSA